jgi:hypothetical protein
MYWRSLPNYLAALLVTYPIDSLVELLIPIGLLFCSYNIVFQLCKSLFEDRREASTFLCGPRI